MSFWRWLTAPDPAPGFTAGKVWRFGVRFFLFVLLVTLVSGLLNLTPLKPYLNTFWGSILLVLVMYVPLARWLNVDMLRPARVAPSARLTAGAGHPQKAASKPKKARYAGVSKKPPHLQGRR